MLLTSTLYHTTGKWNRWDKNPNEEKKTKELWMKSGSYASIITGRGNKNKKSNNGWTGIRKYGKSIKNKKLNIKHLLNGKKCWKLRKPDNTIKKRKVNPYKYEKTIEFL